jgi:hypothetical protein
MVRNKSVLTFVIKEPRFVLSMGSFPNQGALLVGNLVTDRGR